jgi:hypothetical protein
MVAAMQSDKAEVEEEERVALLQHIREGDENPFVIRERKIGGDVAHR